MKMNDILKTIVVKQEGNEPVVLVNIIAGSGSMSKDAGAMMAVFSDGMVVGSIGGGVVEDEARKLAVKMFNADQRGISSYKLTNENISDLGMICGGDIRYYTEPLVRAGKVYIFGGGQMARELVPVLKRTGFYITVYEDDEKFAGRELFPKAENIVLYDFTKISEKIAVREADYVVIMTRGHKNDFDVLEQMLKSEARYVDCMGDAKKLADIKKRLVETGVPQRALNKLYSPIGLKIKAGTLAEIAISIAAEMILFRAESL